MSVSVGRQSQLEDETSRWGWALTSAVLICLILVGWALRATMVVTMPLADGNWSE